MPRGSWYSQLPAFGWVDPEDRPNSAAYRVFGRPIPDSQQGIALPTRGGLGKWYNVTPPGSDRPTPLQQTDLGPSPWTGRGVDISAAGAHQMGYTPRNFPTDANFKVEPIDLTGLGLAAGYRGGVPGDNTTAIAEGPSPGRREQQGPKMPASLMDMFSGRAPLEFSPTDAAGGQTDFGGALASRSNSLIGLGLGLLQPSNPLRGQSTWGNALEGFQSGSGIDTRQAQLKRQTGQDAYQRQQDAQHQANWERQFARGDVTDAQKAMRDVLGPNPSPQQQGEFMKNYYASKTDPGGWILKDIIDPSDPDGERKITVQEHNRTGQIRPAQLPGQTGAAPADPFASGAPPVFSSGPGGFSAAPPAAPGAAAPGQRQARSITLPNGEVVSEPPGLNKASRQAWANHVATTAAKMQAGELTEGQAKYSIYATGMEIAQQELKGLEGQGTSQTGKQLSRVPWGLGTYAQTTEYQNYRNAKDAWLNAKLRAESGATINPDEFARDERIYFPQPGENEEQVAAKARLRENITHKMTKAGGPGYQSAPPIATPQGGGSTTPPAGNIPPPPPGFILRQSNR